MSVCFELAAREVQQRHLRAGPQHVYCEAARTAAGVQNAHTAANVTVEDAAVDGILDTPLNACREPLPLTFAIGIKVRPGSISTMHDQVLAK